MFISPPAPPPTIPQAITIWVHGTRPSAVFPFLSATEEMDDIMIKSFSDLKQESKTKALLTALAENDQNFFPIEDIYSFGWDGDLSVASRKAASDRLYLSIKSIVEKVTKKHGSAPPICIIAHSHGGNVVLHMLDHARENAFTINKTILLACPVQKETMHNIQSPFFGTVYSIHSHVDMIQIMEPQRLQPYKAAFAQFQENRSLEVLKEAYLLGINQPLFSERHFPYHHNLIQANVVWQSATPSADESKTTNKVELFFHKVASKIMTTRRGVLHTEFITPAFMHNLAQIIVNLDNHRAVHGILSRDIEIVI